jgi:amino acid permease
VFLFSLLGITPIPELIETVGRRREDVMRAIIRATVVSAFLTYAFGVFGWLVSSGLIGRNPADLIYFLPPVIAFIFPLAGFLAIITSFLTTSLDLRNMFHLDYHFSNIAAWAVSLGIPLVLLFLTPRDFLGTVGLIGAVFSSAIAVIVSLMGYVALSKSIKRGTPLQKILWARFVPILVSIILISSGILWYLISSPNT